MIESDKQPETTKKNIFASYGVLALLGLGIATVKHFVVGPSEWYSWIMAAAIPPALLSIAWWVENLQDKQKPLTLEFEETWGVDREISRASSAPQTRFAAEEKPVCSKCGTTMFDAHPDRSNKHEIDDFAVKIKVFNNDARAGEVGPHPGLYCPNGCTAIIAAAPEKVNAGTTAENRVLCLIHPGPNKREVLSLINEITGVAPDELEPLLKIPCLEIVNGPVDKISDYAGRLEALGAHVHIAVKNN